VVPGNHAPGEREDYRLVLPHGRHWRGGEPQLHAAHDPPPEASYPIDGPTVEKIAWLTALGITPCRYPPMPAAAPPDQHRLVKEAHRHLLLRPSTTSRCRSLVTPPLLAEAADEAASAFGTGCGNGAQIASGRFPGLRGGSVPLATPNSRVSSRAAASPGGYRRGQPPGLHGHQHPEPAGVQTAQGAASTPPPPGTVADTGTGTAFPNG
jgi:hypothetical protein